MAAYGCTSTLPVIRGDFVTIRHTNSLSCCIVVRPPSENSITLFASLFYHTPSYLADDCCLATDARPRRLRSADTRTLLVSRAHIHFSDRAFCAAGPRVWNSTVGRRSFPVSGATVWNDLPLHVASAPSLAVFRQRLETFLFSRSYQDTIIWLV